MSAAHATDTPGSHGTVPMVPEALMVCFAAPFGAWASGSGNSLLHPTPYDSRGTSGRPARTETRRGGGMSPGRAVRGHAEQAACSGIPKGACRPSEDAERSSAGREEPARRPRPGEAPRGGPGDGPRHPGTESAGEEHRGSSEGPRTPGRVCKPGGRLGLACHGEPSETPRRRRAATIGHQHFTNAPKRGRHVRGPCEAAAVCASSRGRSAGERSEGFGEVLRTS